MPASVPGVQGPVPESFHKDIAALEEERVLLLPLVKTDLARAFLEAIDGLPTPGERVLYWRRKPHEVCIQRTETSFQWLPRATFRSGETPVHEVELSPVDP